jgi:hypothetical protein
MVFVAINKVKYEWVFFYKKTFKKQLVLAIKKRKIQVVFLIKKRNIQVGFATKKT